MSGKMRERQIQCGESPAKKSGSLLCSFGSHCRLPQCPGGWRGESGRRPQGLAAKFCAEQAMVLCIGLLSTPWSISSSGSTEAPSGNGHENSGTHSGGVMPASAPPFSIQPGPLPKWTKLWRKRLSPWCWEVAVLPMQDALPAIEKKGSGWSAPVSTDRVVRIQM